MLRSPLNGAQRNPGGAVALGVAALCSGLSCEVAFVIQRSENVAGAEGSGAAPSTAGAPEGASTSGGEAGSGVGSDSFGGAPNVGGSPEAGGAAGAAVQPFTPCQKGLYGRYLSAGEYHACATDYVTSELYCWGLGSSGQLGSELAVDSFVPVKVQSPHGFGEVHTGTVSTCATTDSVDLLCWGSNMDGVLADGTDQQQLTPVPTRSGVTDFCMSSGYVVAASTTGVFAWGANTAGQLGLGDATVGTTVRSETLVGSMLFAAMTAGHSHACAIDYVTGLPYCAGSNQAFRLGIAGGSHATFVQVSSTRFQRLSAGYDRTCGVTMEGELHCWGHNVPVTFEGQPAVVSAPTKVGSSEQWDDVSVGFDHVCANDKQGRLFCAGDNSQGELGTSGDSSAAFIEPLPGLRTFHVSAGRNFTCLLKEPDWAVVCFGSNEAGKLGRDDADEGPGAPALVCLPPL